MTEEVTVEAECTACGASGIFRGPDHPKGVGTVCTECDGEGKKTITYTPFLKGLAIREDIEVVVLRAWKERGKGDITYIGFLEGKKPAGWHPATAIAKF